MKLFKDLKFALSTLKDWQEEVERAFAVAEENARQSALWFDDKERYVPVQKTATILDLAAYRSMKASA